MNDSITFLANLSRVLAHTVVFEASAGKVCEAFNIVLEQAMQTAGALLQDKPKVPQFVPIDTQKEQLKATLGNITNLASLQSLAGKTNVFNQEELNKMIESAAPGYKDMLGKVRDTASTFLSGEIPKDVQDQIARNAAYQSLTGGFGGKSGMQRNLVARDLGLTSLDLIQKGVDAGTRWAAMARSGTAAQFDPASMFITPQQRIQTAMFNRTGQFQRDWMKNQLDSIYSTRTIMGQELQRVGAEWNQASTAALAQGAGAATSMMGAGAGGSI